MILYSFRRCPYAMRARFCLIYAQASYEHREILLRDKPREMLDISAKGTVPVLHTEEAVIDESLDIILWTLDKLENAQSLKLSKAEHEEALLLIQENDTVFKKALDRYKYYDRDGLSRDDAEAAWNQCCDFIKKIESRLEKQTCLFGDAYTFADFAIFPFLRQCRNVDIEKFTALPIPHTLAWIDRILESELFDQVMHKHPTFESKLK